MQDNQAQAYQLSTLGPFALTSKNGQAISVRGSKVRALLVLLAVEPAVSQRRDALMAILWPELSQETAQSNLRQTLYRLRQAVPYAAAHADQSENTAVPLLLTDRSSVQINPAADINVDVVSFRRLILEIRTHDHQRLQDCDHCRDRLLTAVRLYRDNFLADLYLADSYQFENWAGSWRTELQQDMLLALDDLCQIYLESGQFEKAEPLARRQLQLDPLRESAQRQLMLLLAQSGRKAEALAQFDLCRRYLAKEMGTTPAAETIALFERIQSGELDTTIRPGIRLREYIIMEEMNSGAFGSIYRAYQPSLEREVAIKVIRPQYANRPEFVRRLETEARLVARLEHPHIVPLYDYWRDASGAFLVMRWLRQGSLDAALLKGPLPIETILRLVDQVTGALAETHKQGIVHRDLKPGNIVLDEQENAYLTDFGIAADLDVDQRQTAPGTLMGSPAYIAPEQLRNEPVTPRTDIYSLGIILFELLTGKLPFNASSLAALIQQHLNQPLPSVSEYRPDLPVAVDWVLGKATAKDPHARYTDVISFAASIRQALGQQTGLNQIRDKQSHDKPLPLRLKPAGTREHRLDFVARERQLDSLNSYLDHTLAGEGQIVCITGGAGRGKTALIHEFTRQAMNSHQDLLVIFGSCSVFSASGDPYLPFRQCLAMLTADIEAQLRAGALSSDHAQRLRTALPTTITAIMDHGPELVNVLISGKALLDRATSLWQDGASRAEELRHMVASDSLADFQTKRKTLFSQFTAVLQTICQIHPLILVLDDLQWVDRTSASLLFHLSRHITGQRLLIICSYRREEVALGRDGERHPMDKVLFEAKRVYGSIWIDLAELNQTEERQFVNNLLDRESHRLSDRFRRALFDHTAGHALFTIELLRAMQDRGDLVLDETGQWIENPTLDWEKLPPRIEGVIEERIGRLSQELRSLLNVAAVEGTIFTAEVMAGIEQTDIRQILRLLSRDLEGIHHLIHEQEEIQVNQAYITRYQFGHVLIQQYLYAQLGSGERRLLHAQIADGLQQIVQAHWQPFAAELAWHWQKAGRPDQSLEKWLWLGDQARTAHAHAEAESFYILAIKELQDQGHLEIAARTLMKLGLVYTADFQPEKAQEAYDRAFALWQPTPLPVKIKQTQPSNAVLRLATQLPVSFDPGLIDDDVSTFLVTQLFEGLVRVGQDQNVLPAVGKRWEMLDGGTRYIFIIRDNIAWNDGSPLTASDFAYAWLRNLHPDTKSPSAHLLYVLKNGRNYAESLIDDAQAVGVKALDDRTLEIHLERPTAYLPYLIAHTVAFPLPQHVVEVSGGSWAEPPQLVSNGPYQVEKVDDDRLTLSRNPHFAGQFGGNVGTVECLFSDDYESILKAYERSELDVVNLIHADPDTIARADSLFGKDLVSIPRWSTFYLCFRCDRPPFSDIRVRQAFAHALDRQSLAIKAFQGLRQAATGGFVPPGMPGYSPNIALAYNPQHGRDLLSQAGFPAGAGFPTVEWTSMPGGDRTISFLRNAWKKNLNLDIQPTVMHWESFKEKLNSEPAHLTILGWGADIPDPENMLRTTFHSQDGINIPHWANEQFDLLTDKAEQVIDHNLRMDLYQQADQILVAGETAVLPLSYSLGRILVKPWVRLPITPAISMSFRFASVVRPS